MLLKCPYSSGEHPCVPKRLEFVRQFRLHKNSLLPFIKQLACFWQSRRPNPSVLFSARFQSCVINDAGSLSRKAIEHHCATLTVLYFTTSVSNESKSRITCLEGHWCRPRAHLRPNRGLSAARHQLHAPSSVQEYLQDRPVSGWN